MAREPMTCPGCGTAMNLHAVKRVEPHEAAFEAWACAGCGGSATRDAEPEDEDGAAA